MEIKKTYRVAGLDFSLEGRRSLWEGLGNYSPFEVPEADGEGILFSLDADPAPGQFRDFAEGRDLVPLFVGRTEPGFPQLDMYGNGDGYYVEMAPLKGLPIAGKLLLDSDFRRGSLCLGGTADTFAASNSLMLMYALAGAGCSVLEMHASVVTWKGKGYMFLGRSGTGKSTHSGLWLKYIEGTELLNDDNPVIRVGKDGQVRVFGSPWSGKTPCYKNADVPLGGIVRLSQAPYNRIERLGTVEAYASVMASASSFRPIRQIAEGQHSTIVDIVSRIPCWHLECLPDEEAARLCCEAIAGGN